MGKLNEIFKILQIQKRIVSAITIHGNTVLKNVFSLYVFATYLFYVVWSLFRVKDVQSIFDFFSVELN